MKYGLGRKWTLESLIVHPMHSLSEKLYLLKRLVPLKSIHLLYTATMEKVCLRQNPYHLIIHILKEENPIR